MNAVANLARETAPSAVHVLEPDIADACARIAPMWPLKHFVAVNPFLGFSGQPFEAACATMRRVARADMLPSRDFMAGALAKGIIRDDDLAAALAAAPRHWRLPASAAALRAAAAAAAGPGSGHVVATVAETLDRLAGGDRRASRTGFMIDEISKFCAAYFDEGQSVWRLPARGLPLFAAWRETMRHDRNPEAMGIAGFRATVAALPSEPVAAIGAVVEALGIPAAARADYLHRALFDIGGWAAYVRHLAWKRALDGRADDSLVQLLAIRVVWGYAIFVQRKDSAFVEAWNAAMRDAAVYAGAPAPGEDPELVIDLLLFEAYERAQRRRLFARLAGAPLAPTAARPALQAAFCIDVRSEVFRRALESVCPDVETIGFAGFFGFPIEYVPIGRVEGDAQCPVLLRPSVVVCEAVDGASDAEERDILQKRLLRRRAAKTAKAFKLSAVSSFAFVETAGLAFAAKIVGDALGLTRPAVDPDVDGLDRATLRRVGPRVSPRIVGGRATGFDDARRVAMAEAALRAMSLTGPFARIALIVGHGGASVNNPHASSLDCGACGGHSGEANARVAAAILNDPAVRVGLRARGIAIPDDSWFLGCLHDTTTDEVTIFDAHKAPATHRAEIAEVKRRLHQAAALARDERAPRFGLPSGAHAAIKARARDWSQVRPEWGLAGNHAFIAAPRRLTAGANLEGRAFLHSYDWRRDPDQATLALIMTAPMVVASWINLQYYGSTVNNRAFGAGDKTLHNVAGAVLALEGAGGDPRVGLPWQSVHDGRALAHDPVKLNVLIAAPLAAIDRVLAEHASARELVENRWVHLFALSDEGRPTHAHRGAGNWEILT